MAAWGAISACTAAVQNFGGLLACRFLLGFLESAFFPGAVVSGMKVYHTCLMINNHLITGNYPSCQYYLSAWYTKRELALRTSYDISCF